MIRKFETLITRTEYLRFLDSPEGQGIPKPDWWRPPQGEPEPTPQATLQEVEPGKPKPKPTLPKAEAIRLLSAPNNLSRERFIEAGGKDRQYRDWAHELEVQGKRTRLRPGPRPKIPD